MKFTGNLILRMIVVFFGFVLAVIAAELFLFVGLIAGYFPGILAGTEQDALVGGAFVFLVWFPVAMYGAFSAFLPGIIAVAIGEMMRWRGMIANMMLGGACTLFLGLSNFTNESHSLPSENTIIILLATGFVAGFVYWLIAGRGAGSWMDKPNPAR